MKTLPRIPDAVLRAESAPIDPREVTSSLIDSLFKNMRECGGTGLAAPQLGMLYRLAVVEFAKNRLVLINPTLQPVDPKRRGLMEEGCLSSPGQRYLVSRAEKVRVTFTAGESRVTVHAEGVLAVILQHELDHLDGVLIDDRGTRVEDAA